MEDRKICYPPINYQSGQAEVIEEVSTPPPADYVGKIGTHPIFNLTIKKNVALTPLETIPYEDCLEGADQVKLSKSEIEHFKSQGFIVKRGLVNDKEGFRRLEDYFWEHVPDYYMQRDETSTWTHRGEKLTTEDSQCLGPVVGNYFKMRSPTRIGTENWLLALTTNHPNVQQVVEQFIGTPIRPTQRVRGIYGLAPLAEDEPKRLGPHVDPIPTYLSAMVLINEIPPRCGGFVVWPGSHIFLHPIWDTCHSTKISSTDRLMFFFNEFDRIVSNVSPVEFSGSPGDVIFWHPRLIHSGGINFSATDDKPRIRMVVPCDFQKGDLSFFDDDEFFGPGKTNQWWIDAFNFAEDTEVPTKDNLWHDWLI